MCGPASRGAAARGAGEPSIDAGSVPRRILIIFNPSAGRGRRPAKRLRRVVVELERLGCISVVRRTRAPGDAERLAHEADPSFDLIVAAGGDGTVNEVVNGLSGSPRPLAVLPLGTGNVLANEIGLPRRAREIAALIAGATPRPIWPGRVGHRLFVAMVGVGFDADVISRLDDGLRRRIGKLAYAWPILACLWCYRRREFVVRAEGSTFRAASAVIAKGRYYAGRFSLAPEARIADPTLHAVLFRRAGRLAALRYLAAIAFGVLHRLPDVSVFTARTVLLDSAEPSVVEADGEIVGRLPVLVQIPEKPLLLVQPGPSDPAARRAEPAHFIAIIAGVLGFDGVASAIRLGGNSTRRRARGRVGSMPPGAARSVSGQSCGRARGTFVRGG